MYKFEKINTAIKNHLQQNEKMISVAKLKEHPARSRRTSKAGAAKPARLPVIVIPFDRASDPVTGQKNREDNLHVSYF